jgi:subtilisin family serine protease
MNDPEQRREMGLPDNDHDPGPYMVELNILYAGGLEVAAEDFHKLWNEAFKDADPPTPTPVKVSKSYFHVLLSVKQWRKLLQKDAERAQKVAEHSKKSGQRVIYKLWPDFKVKALVDRSIATVKADAAFRAYSATGKGITWAVVDSGIDGEHPHFGSKDDPDRSVIHHRDVFELHRDFSSREGTREDSRRRALQDELGHGTHVAGIISGGLPRGSIEIATEPQNGTPRTDVETPQRCTASRRGACW